MNQNLNELINRGAKINIIQKLGILMMDRIMRVETMKLDDQTKEMVELEWWKFRNGSEAKRGKEAPIWEGTGIGMVIPEFQKLLYVPQDEAPTKATDEWLKINEKWTKGLTEPQKRAYRNQVMRESYKSLYAKIA